MVVNVNKWRNILVLNLIAYLFFAQPVFASVKTASTKTISVKVTLDKDFYLVGDTFTVKASVNNKGRLTKKYNRLTLAIFSPLKPNEPFVNLNTKNRYKILRRDWYKNLPPGKTSINIKREVDNKRWRPGVYPLEFSLTLASQEKFTAAGYLTILNSQQPASLNLSVGLNLHQPFKQTPDNVFINNSLIKLLGESTEKPGPLWAPLIMANRFPEFKLNLIVSPVLVKQLETISKGYKFKDGSKIRSVSANQPTAVNAKSWLAALFKQAKEGKIEVLTTSYSHAPLTTLKTLDWYPDISWQIKKAKKFWQGRQISAVGFVPFELSLNSFVLSKLEPAFNYTLINPRQLKKDSLAAGWLKAHKKEIGFIKPDEEGSSWLKRVSVRQLGNELTAFLVHRAVNQNKGRVALISLNLKQTQDLEQLMHKLKELNWVRVVGFSQLLPRREKVVASRFSAGSAKERFYTKSWVKSLRQARLNYLNFSSVVDVNNKVKKNLQEKLLLAEAGDWGKSQQNVGLSYIKAINEQVSNEFRKIKLSPPTQITFSTQSGKVPVPIENGTNYPVKLVLIVKGEGLKVLKNKKEQIIGPKENLIAFEVTNLKYGATPIVIEAKAGRQVIATAKLVVSVSGNLRILVVASSVFSILVVIGLLFFKFFKIKIQPKNKA